METVVGHTWHEVPEGWTKVCPEGRRVPGGCELCPPDGSACSSYWGPAGFGGDGGPARKALLRFGCEVPVDFFPMVLGGGLAASSDGTIHVADSANHRIRVVTPDGLIDSEVGSGELPDGAGTSIRCVDAPCEALDVSLHCPSDVELDEDGTLYIADTMNHCVRKLSPDGLVRDVAGRCGEKGSSGDGGPALEALLDTPHKVRVDWARNRLLIVDLSPTTIRSVGL